MPYLGQIYNTEVHLTEGFHLGMVNDKRRFQLFKDAFEEVGMKDKVVCDLGAGTGMLSWEALKQGAKHAYMVEIDPHSIEALEAILAAHPLKDKVTVINKDICSLTKDDFSHHVDLFYSETFGGALYNEGFIVYLNHALSLFPEAQSIPFAISSTLKLYPVDFSDASQWPQVGDPAIIEGYKKIYELKRFQTDFSYHEEPSLEDEFLFWTKHQQVLSKEFVIFGEKNDSWIALNHNVWYSPSINSKWTSSAWFVNCLNNGDTFEIIVEGQVNPVLVLKSKV